MIDLEHRQMYRSNGLIDDFVLHGSLADYRSFALQVQAAIRSGEPEQLPTSSPIVIEIACDPSQAELFTSLQNQDDLYPDIKEWAQRSILRLRGRTEVLEALCTFLIDLSGRGEGYSYISEYSEQFGYAKDSPEWRLHVRVP
mgnify:CR=1 FL=1